MLAFPVVRQAIAIGIKVHYGIGAGGAGKLGQRAEFVAVRIEEPWEGGWVVRHKEIKALGGEHEFQLIEQAVAIGIRQAVGGIVRVERVVGVIQVEHFKGVVDPVTVTINIERVGFQEVDFVTIRQRVAIGVVEGRVGVVGVHLLAILQSIAIGIDQCWVGMEGEFQQVGEAVAIGVAVRIGWDVRVEIIGHFPAVWHAVVVTVSQGGIGAQAMLLPVGEAVGVLVVVGNSDAEEGVGSHVHRATAFHRGAVAKEAAEGDPVPGSEIVRPLQVIAFADHAGPSENEGLGGDEFLASTGKSFIDGGCDAEGGCEYSGRRIRVLMQSAGDGLGAVGPAVAVVICGGVEICEEFLVVNVEFPDVGNTIAVVIDNGAGGKTGELMQEEDQQQEDWHSHGRATARSHPRRSRIHLTVEPRTPP